jgi:hypothetical protein
LRELENGMDESWWTVVGVVVSGVVGTGGLIVAIFALLQARRARELAARANRLTGAMESHSDLQLKIAARKQGIKPVWWDRSRHGKFPSLATIKHDEEVNLETIYFDFPLELRKQPDTESAPRRRRRWWPWG